MTKPINPYKPDVDWKFIIEQGENNNMSVWEFLKGFVDVDDVSGMEVYDINSSYLESVKRKLE